MLKFMIVVGVLMLTAGIIGALPAAAAPDNENTFSFDVSCDEPLGDIAVTEIGRGQGDRVVFSEDGQVLVAKHITGVSNSTLSIEGGPAIPVEEDEPFEEGGQGQGFADRLISCDFTIEFEDTFTLNKKALQFFELDEEFLGATATVSGTVTGTAEVLAPGQPEA